MSREDVGFSKKGLTVEVRNGNIDQALKLLKKRMQNEGVFRDMKRIEEYEKPSQERKRRKAEGRKNHLKRLAKARRMD